MTDPDTIAAFNAINAAKHKASKPTPLENAVIRHLEGEAEPLPASPDAKDLSLPPTDGEIFDGVPKALPEEITEKVEKANLADDDWDDAVTAVCEVPRLRPTDPTGCMM